MKNFIRLPESTDRSLRAWSAVDEHILKHLEEEKLSLENVTILHDRFGYMTCQLIANTPTTLTYLDSQKQSILRNASTNWISIEDLNIRSILDDIPPVGKIAVMKVPKSFDLFRLYLIKLVNSLPVDGAVVAGFMTRHFSKSMLDIAAEYFNEVSQSKAWKKSRLLLLTSPKKTNDKKIDIFKTILYQDHQYKQYLGVFSANHIDYATQFLIEHLELRNTENSFLDIGCGNGVIGKHLLEQRDWEEAVMIDDSILATASTQINLENHNAVQIKTQYHLDNFSDGQFDLVITNPPFHFEYEVDPSIAIRLMSNTQRILSNNGRLIIVANRHLNYKSQLSQWYDIVNILIENDKFIIYEAMK